MPRIPTPPGCTDAGALEPFDCAHLAAKHSPIATPGTHHDPWVVPMHRRGRQSNGPNAATIERTWIRGDGAPSSRQRTGHGSQAAGEPAARELHILSP
ncbi:MAG: hypothetical protein AW07_01377 [Candidatus Accumulibacter sp. SK-11]|nr:MAG: hypothetical protein AW07_01377 [Candidatus Accumulibacter sp. SK-11]